jgi:glutaredoxin 3
LFIIYFCGKILHLNYVKKINKDKDMTNDIEHLSNGDFEVIPLDKKCTIWTINNCSYCSRAKNLLEKYSIKFEERNLSDGVWANEQLLEDAPGVRTMPQIFIDGKHIGGFDDLDAYMFLNFEDKD